MKKKRLCSLLLVLLFTGTILAGCGGSPANNSENNTDTAKNDETSTLDFPKSNIDMVVTFAAGGSNDVLARAVTSFIDLPTTMTVTNIEGGSGTIGSMEVAHEPPDGYTLLLHSGESLMSQYYSGVLSEPIHEDLELIANLAVCYEALLISAKNPNFSTLEEFVAYAKANPGKVTIAGPGSRGRIEAVALDIIRALGIDAEYVSYDSSAACRTALLGGHIDVTFTQVAGEVSYIDSGDCLAMAVTAEERVPMLGENCVTFKELGYDIISGMTLSVWAPPETPQEIQDYLADQFALLYENEDYVTTLEEDLDFTPFYQRGEEARAHYTDQSETIKRIIDNMLAG